MQYMIRIISITLLSIFIFSCNSDDNPTVAIESTLIVKGNLYGNGNEGIGEQNLVITDQTSWNNLMTQINSVNDITSTFSETNIDFSEYQIIAVFDELKGNGGYELDLNIATNSENIIVEIIDVRPGGNPTSVITQPFYIAKISVSSLPVTFE